MESLLLFTILFVAGASLLYLGISGFLGNRRHSYILWSYYGYVSSGINYGSIPLGTTFIIWAFIFAIPLPEYLSWDLLFVSFGIGMVGILFGIFQPKFMMPEWYRWLKTNHKDILPYLREDVEKMDYKEWRKQTDTQEELEAWVASVRHKRELERQNYWS